MWLLSSAARTRSSAAIGSPPTCSSARRSIRRPSASPRRRHEAAERVRLAEVRPAAAMQADGFRLVLSLLPVLRSCCGRLPCVAGPDDGSTVGLLSATYNAQMPFMCMLAFWALTTWGLCSSTRCKRLRRSAGAPRTMTALTDCCEHARCRGARCALPRTLPRTSSTGCPTSCRPRGGARHVPSRALVDTIRFRAIGTACAARRACSKATLWRPPRACGRRRASTSRALVGTIRFRAIGTARAARHACS